MWVDNLIACEVLLTMMLNHAWLTPQELEELENVNHKVIHIKIGLKLTNLFNLQDVTHKLNTHPKESTETYLLELTPYKGLCVVICLLNGH